MTAQVHHDPKSIQGYFKSYGIHVEYSENQDDTFEIEIHYNDYMEFLYRILDHQREEFECYLDQPIETLIKKRKHKEIFKSIIQFIIDYEEI